MVFWLPYSVSQSTFYFSHYFYPCSPSLLPVSVFLVYDTSFLFPFLSIFAVRISCSFDLYQSNFSIFFVLSNSIFLSLSLWVNHFLLLFLQFFLSLSSVICWYFLCPFFLSHLYETLFFLYSLSVYFFLSNYLLFFVILSPWFFCSSTIYYSSHSLYVTVTLSLNLSLLLYQFRRCPNAISSSSFCFTLSRSLSLSLSLHHVNSLCLFCFHDLHLTVSFYFSLFR